MAMQSRRPLLQDSHYPLFLNPGMPVRPKFLGSDVTPQQLTGFATKLITIALLDKVAINYSKKTDKKTA